MEILRTVGENVLGLFILAGAVICAVSTFGIIRLPDVYLRSHAATKSATLGVLIILNGAFLYFMIYMDHISAKLLLGIVFVFLTSPVAGHLNGRAAHRLGVPLWKGSIQDELQHARSKREHVRGEKA